MISVSNKEAKKIFLTSNTNTTIISDKIDIIVSPEFYWVRKFEIPVKSETQARHVLPTLFEDIVNEEQALTYQVIKLEENLFLCFAYNNKKIYEVIKKSNIPTSNIQAFYFAQNECKNFNSFEVDNQKFTYTSDGILIKVPNNLLQETIKLEKVINSIKLSSHKLQIKLYNDLLSSKFYYTMFAILGLIITLNTLKYFDYTLQISKLNQNIQEIKNKNSLPNSILQTNSILKDYDTTISQEIQKREAISYIFSNPKFNLQTLNLDTNSIELEYLSVNKNEVQDFLNKKFKKVDFKENSFSLKVSIKL